MTESTHLTDQTPVVPLPRGHAHAIRSTLMLAESVFNREGYENAAIQCKMGLDALNDAMEE